MRRVWLIADDYGLAPGVSYAILDLLDNDRLCGTGCMTVFAEWPEQAAQLTPHAGGAGLHLTLTDQPALSGRSPLAPHGILPPLATLLRLAAIRRLPEAAVNRELDAQLDAFTSAMGRSPAFLDGHQHVHFLPAVRRWLLALPARLPQSLPWLRGAPAFSKASLKTRVVAAMAAGFDRQMRTGGYAVHGPLTGFYDWSGSQDFGDAFDNFLAGRPDGVLVMCHPGTPDATLRRRDSFTEQRRAEYDFLRGDRFPEALARHGAELARP